ncbi:MAG: xanthine dehydrogenase family protein [bacterium]|nr:xanthine dehydrogenase family protein [bacterium]
MTRVVGTRLRRPEGPDKVTGRAMYVADDVPVGCWWGKAIRSPVAHGELLGFELDPAFDFSQVVLVRAADIPGVNVVDLIVDDQPILASDAIEHWGQPLLLVAAADQATLDAAVRAIDVRVRESEPLLDMEAAEVVFKEIVIDKGDVDAALASAPHVLRRTYHTDSQEQMYIEPQGAIAWPEAADGTVLVRGSLQCPYYVQRALARALDIEPARARVVQAATGGGFGGKEEYPSVVACHAALLARAAGQPVAVIYDRHEDLAVTPKRHPARVRHATGYDDDGRLLAMDVDVLLDGGAFTTLSPVVLSRAAIHAAGAYRCDAVRIRGRVVKTNHVPYGAFRGFGAPQVCFAVERQMDAIARERDLHPATLRKRNALRLGDTTATSGRLEESVGSEEVLAKILERTGFEDHPWCQPRPAAGRKRRGAGFSFFFHGAGFTGAGEVHLKAKVDVRLAADGRCEVHSASTEFGQGTVTMFTAIAAEALETGPDDVLVVEPDTGAVPDSGPTVASRTCMVVGGCLARACRELRARIDAHGGQGAEGSFRERARAFLAAGGDGRVEVTYASPPGLVWDDERYEGDAYPAYGWAADYVEVEVDLDTFEVSMERFVSAVDVGKAIQPQLVEGQIEGGSLQALGFAHIEVVGTKDGRFLQDRMATCIIPTTLDAPPMEVLLVEEPFSHGPYGAKGVGELPMDGGAPAVASAIEDALGISIDRVPATPERLAAAWLAAHPEEAL